METIRKIFDYYYIRLSHILNLKKDIKFPDLDLNDFNSHITFFQEINRIFLDYNKNNNVLLFYENKTLKKKILDIVRYNPKEEIDKFGFVRIYISYMNTEEYIPNNIDRPKIANFSREIK